MSQPLASKPVLSSTITAADKIEGHRFVGFDDRHAGANEAVQGVSSMDADQGMDLTVHHLGSFDMKAPAPIAKGDLVASDAEGRPISTNDPALACGRALKAAVVVGGVVTVLLK